MRIIISSIQVPFIQGGSIYHINGLENALKSNGHEVEIVSLPFKFSPNNFITDSINYWKNLDFNDFNGYRVDKVISLQFPSYYVNHDDKVLWLMHQHRAVYELFEKNYSKELLELKEIITKNDTNEISKIKKRYSNSKNVSNRLEKYNSLSSEPLYHPPHAEELFYSDDDLGYIFCPSRLEELKRQDLLIKAMQYCKSNVVCIIAGIGGQYENYQKLINKLNLNHKVKLVGYISQSEKLSYYAKSIGVFFGPYDEDYGYITLEAMLSSKPVITCSDSGGPLEFVLNDDTGFIVEPNPMDIAKKIDYLYENRNKATQLGKNALEHYKQKNISWDNVVNTLLN